MAEMHKWHGFRELEQNLKALGTEMHERGVKRMMSRAAVPMRDDARVRAPVLAVATPTRRPGTVRNAIHIWRKRATEYAVTYYVGVRRLSGKAVAMFKQNNRKGGKAANSANNPNDPYFWFYLELGTSKMAARPFLRPAFEAKKLEAVRVALEEGREFVRKVARQFKRTRST